MTAIFAPSWFEILVNANIFDGPHFSSNAKISDEWV